MNVGPEDTICADCHQDTSEERIHRCPRRPDGRGGPYRIAADRGISVGIIHLKGFDQTPFDSLLEGIEWQQRSVRVYGKTHPQPRLTKWYGPVPYPYSGLSWDAAPMPDQLAKLAQKVSTAAGEAFNSVLCNLYRDGQDTVGWHADDEPLFGSDPIVASLSYGATRTFKLRENGTKSSVSYDLEDGDLIVMGKGMQLGWQHSIPRTARPVGQRINLTFRRCV